MEENIKADKIKVNQQEFSIAKLKLTSAIVIKKDSSCCVLLSTQRQGEVGSVGAHKTQVFPPAVASLRGSALTLHLAPSVWPSRPHVIQSICSLIRNT